jgi:hypothetical protein
VITSIFGLVISLVILLVVKIKTRSVHLKRGPVHYDFSKSAL